MTEGQENVQQLVEVTGGNSEEFSDQNEFYNMVNIKNRRNVKMWVF